MRERERERDTDRQTDRLTDRDSRDYVGSRLGKNFVDETKIIIEL